MADIQDNKGIKMMDLNIATPIDLDACEQILGIGIEFTVSMIKTFLDSSLDVQLQVIAGAINKQDFEEFKFGAHSLKGASGYVGASHIHYSCYFI